MKYKFRINSLLFTTLLCFGSLLAMAQERKVNGTVTSTDNIGIPGVSIILKGTQEGTITDADGKFEISAASGQTLQFSFVGYKSKEVAVGNSSNVTVILEEDVTMLNEVVAIGYGSQSRQMVTTSVSKLDTKVLRNTALSNAASSLQGTVSGLRVINTSGQPGSSPTILLRGGASINSPGAPLVVVDGIVRTFNDINPSDIESIEVLKDAASTAIYGARANNGVILVTTKKGKAGFSEIQYKVKTGINYLRRAYDYVDAGDFLHYNRLGVKRTNIARAQAGVAH
jgi:TonB-dependent SusC/RagA subfamily outer membrane receptor